MATVKRFEQLLSWQKARVLTHFIYQLTKRSSFDRDYGLKNQIQRAAVSTMANQAEGFSRGTKIELINYFFIAKGSAGEVQSLLYAALDQRYITKKEFQKGYQLAEEVQRLIQTFTDKVKSGALKGLQYKQGLKKDEWSEFVEEAVKEGLITKEDFRKFKERGLL